MASFLAIRFFVFPFLVLSLFPLIFPVCLFYSFLFHRSFPVYLSTPTPTLSAIYLDAYASARRVPSSKGIIREGIHRKPEHALKIQGSPFCLLT